MAARNFDSSTGRIAAPTYGVQGATYNNVGGAIQAVDGALTSLDARLGNLASFTAQLSEQVQKNRRIASGGVAAAMASSQIRYSDKPGSVSLGLGGGYYDGQGGLAVGLGGTTEDGHWRYNASVNYAPSAQRLGAAGGVTYTW